MALNLEQQPTEYLNLDTPWSQLNQDPEVIDNKTQRYSYGMSPLMDSPTIKSYLDNGMEDSLRINAAARVNAERNGIAANVLRRGGTPNLTNNARPSSVLEEKVGEKLANNFYAADGEQIEDDNGTFSRITENNPELTKAALRVLTDHAAYSEALYNELQDASKAAEIELKSQLSGGLGSRGFDWTELKNILGVTSLWTERGVIPGTFWQGGLLGGNLEAGRKALEDIPDVKDRIDALKQASHKLIADNPRAAVHFLSYLYQPSILKQNFDNLASAVDASFLLKAGVGTALGARRWLELQRMMREAAGRHPEMTVGDIAATAADAVGRPEEAGKIRASADIVSQIRGTGDPTADMERGMYGVFRTRIGEIQKGGPGQGGVEVYNRIIEDIDKGSQSLILRSRDANRILRTGDVLAIREFLNKAYEEMQSAHPWFYDNILNTGPFKFDEAALPHLVKYERHTGSFIADHFLGREDGSMFGSVEETADHLRAKGIPIYSIHGVPVLGAETGAHIHAIPTGAPAPGSTKSLEEILAQSAKDARLSYKNKEGLERLGTIAGKEPIETTKVGPYTAYRPANGIYGQGKGFYAALRVPLPETGTMFQAAIETPAAMKSNKGWLNSWGIGKLRTADDVLNQQITINRKLAMFGPGIFQHEVAKALEPLQLAKAPFRGKNWGEVYNNFGKSSKFERMLIDLQKQQKDFHSIPELEDYWHTKYGEMPDDVIVRGYFAKKMGDDIDKSFRDVVVTKNMNLHGVERHILSVKDESPQTQQRDERGRFQKIKPLQDIESPEFMGITHKEVPEGSTYYVAIQEGNKFRAKRVDNLTTKADLELKEQVKIGSKRFLELYNASLQPIQDFLENAGVRKGQYIKYVITDKTKTRPLGHFALPQQEGGHLIYPYSNWVHQAKMVVNDDYAHYLGDTNIMAAESGALGRDVAKGLNVIRQHLLNPNKREGLAAAKAAMYEHHLPFSWIDLRRNFKRGAWDLNEPFYNVPDGKTIADIPNHFETTYGNKFREAHKGGSLDKQFQVEFTGERDAYDVMAMHSTGTYTNPTLAYRPADVVDPYTALNRSLHRIIQSTYMDDVKLTSVNDFLQKYKDSFKNISEREVFNNSWYTFNHGELKAGIPFFERQQIEAERYQIRSFVGIPSKYDNWVHSIEQRMADAVYTSETKLGKRATLMAKWSVDKTLKTPDFLRAFVYRAAIGLFAPAQFAVQMMTYASIFGMAGFKRAGQGSIGALLHQISRLPQVNDGILKGLDRVAVNLGHFKPGQWLQIREALENSGFQYVGRETNTLRSGIGPTKIIQSTWGSILDSGELFFNAGERHTRFGAYYTAAAEQLEKSPHGRFTLSERNAILNRADDLSGNMTRASRSMLQTGPLSFPTQFLGYWLRTVELMAGKRLTTPQKLRMFAVYGGLFGFVPGLVGLTPLSPFSENLSKYAEQMGYIPGGSKIADTFFQGVGHMMLQAATGNQYNVGERYGPGPGRGFDFLTSDKPFWQSFTGPIGDMVGQILGNLNPFYQLGKAFVNGQPIPHLSADDWVQPFKVLNIVNTVEKAYVAYNYHDWVSRNGNVMDKDISPANGFFMSLSGLQPSKASRMQISRSIAEDRDFYEKKAESLAKTEYRRFFRDVNNKDYNSAAEHLKNVEIYLNAYQYPTFQRPQLYSEIMDENKETLPDRMLIQRFLGKHIPQGQERESIERFAKEMEIQKQQQGNR